MFLNIHINNRRYQIVILIGKNSRNGITFVHIIFYDRKAFSVNKTKLFSLYKINNVNCLN